jgi:prophage regulatory protein
MAKASSEDVTLQNREWIAAPLTHSKNAVPCESYSIPLTDTSLAALLAATGCDVLIRVDGVCEITALSVPTIYRLMSKGTFPRPFKITASARAWKLSEVLAWVESRERQGA